MHVPSSPCILSFDNNAPTVVRCMQHNLECVAFTSAKFLCDGCRGACELQASALFQWSETCRTRGCGSFFSPSCQLAMEP